jgi:excisionase family DNA binding protein
MDAPQDLLPLLEVAKLLDVHRATANEMVRDGRLIGHRVGPHWFVERQELLRFAETYKRPKNAPKRANAGEAATRWTRLILERLADWHDATPDELFRVIDLHPGNVRKYLCLAEKDGLVERDDFGRWRLTAAGSAIVTPLTLVSSDAQQRTAG